MNNAARSSPLQEGTLNILHLDSGRTLRGGQKQVLLLLAGLQELGHRVVLGCRPGPLAEHAGVRSHKVLSLPLRGEWDLPSAWKIARYAKTGGIDLVHTHDAHTHALARLSQALGMRQPLVVHRRVDFPPSQGLWNRWKYSSGVSSYIVISKAIGTRLERLGVPASKIDWIPSSVDLPSLQREEQSPFPDGVPEPAPGELWLTCVGAIEEEKGQHLLLSCIPDLLEHYPALRFCFLGEGKNRANLEATARTMAVDRHCLFAGFVTPVAPILKRSVCVVLPTLSEGFSLAALEAMAVGTTVIASATGGLKELIASGEDGLLFPPADQDQLKRAIRCALDEPGLRQQLGQKARTKVRQLYTAGQMVQRTVAVYRSVVERQRPASV